MASKTHISSSIVNGKRVDTFHDTRYGGIATVTKLLDSDGNELGGPKKGHATIHGNGHVNIYGLYGGIPGVQEAARQSESK